MVVVEKPTEPLTTRDSTLDSAGRLIRLNQLAPETLMMLFPVGAIDDIANLSVTRPVTTGGGSCRSQPFAVDFGTPRLRAMPIS